MGDVAVGFREVINRRSDVIRMLGAQHMEEAFLPRMSSRCRPKPVPDWRNTPRKLLGSPACSTNKMCEQSGFEWRIAREHLCRQNTKWLVRGASGLHRHEGLRTS